MVRVHPRKIQKWGGPPNIFFGYIAITRPQIDEFFTKLGMYVGNKVPDNVQWSTYRVGQKK